MPEPPLTHRKFRFVYDWIWDNKITLGIDAGTGVLTATHQDGSLASVAAPVASVMEELGQRLIEVVQPVTGRERASQKRREKAENPLVSKTYQPPPADDSAKTYF